jgi:hypothetical protein
LYPIPPQESTFVPEIVPRCQKLYTSANMLQVHVEKIWTRTPEDLIVPRSGANEVVLEPDHGFVANTDLHAPIPVLDGLLSADVAVQLYARPATEVADVESERVVLLVSDLDMLDGGCTLISPKFITYDPDANVTDKMRAAWSNLSPGSLTLKHLGLHSLLAYIRPLGYNESSVDKQS